VNTRRQTLAANLNLHIHHAGNHNRGTHS
jgi:hypothetical protein